MRILTYFIIFFKSFLSIFMKFELFLYDPYFCQNIHRYLSDIFNISVKFKYQYIHI